MNDAEIESALTRVSSEWDKAEKLIKAAEFQRSEVVIAAINELRYAGRRLVDAIRVSGPAKSDPERMEEFKRYISETLSFCHRALHDAVDAIILDARLKIGEYEKTFGAELLSQHFPKIYDIRATLSSAEKIIVLSREDRIKRITEYETLASTHVLTLIEHCHFLESNRELMLTLAAAKRAAEKKDNTRFNLSFWGLSIVTVIAAIVGGIAGIVYDRTTKPAEITPRAVVEQKRALSAPTPPPPALPAQASARGRAPNASAR